jgi:hypothetical protein
MPVTVTDLPPWLAMITPVALMMGAVIAGRFGVGRVVSTTLVAVALAAGIWVLLRGVGASCAIDESECIGATAAAYIYGFFWLMAASLSVALILRADAAGKRGSESTH